MVLRSNVESSLEKIRVRVTTCNLVRSANLET